jgi:hypothetical protein
MWHFNLVHLIFYCLAVTINGDLTIASTARLTMLPNSQIRVFGNIYIFPGSAIILTGVNVTASLITPLSIVPRSGGEIYGRFSAINATNTCGQPALASPSSSSSLSMTIAVQDSSCDSGGLSTEALIGIIVGSIVGGLLIGLAVVLVIRWDRSRRQNNARHAIVAKEMRMK